MKAEALKTAEGGDITTPEQPMAWANGEGKKAHVVTACAADGATEVGTFTVHGSGQ